ncbi:MAG TPA: S-layer homology domain-containing protein [Elainellaceae cyanobacterium]
MANHNTSRHANSDIDDEGAGTQTQEKPRSSSSTHKTSEAAVLKWLLAFLIIVGAGVLLEYFGVIDVAPRFGREQQTRLFDFQGERDFADVPNGFWARPFIQELVQRNAVTGYPDGGFSPEQSVTRAQFAAMVQSAFDIEAVESAEPFQDVPSDFWASGAIASVANEGFLSGYAGNEFRPSQDMTRANVLVALASGLGLETNTSPDEILQTFTDADQIPEYAREAIAAATEAGLVVNYPNVNQLNPTQSATRADVAAMIYQALVINDQAEPFASEFIVNTPLNGDAQ